MLPNIAIITETVNVPGEVVVPSHTLPDEPAWMMRSALEVFSPFPLTPLPSTGRRTADLQEITPTLFCQHEVSF